MGSPVVHFEIGGPDGPVLQQFYRDLFGWKVDVQGAEMGNYGLVSANEGGIGGGLLPTTDGMPVRSYVTFYVQVDDIQVALDKLAGMGGNPIMPPMEIAPGMGHIAMFADPAGNSIGLYSLPSEWDGEMPPKGNDPPVVHFEVGGSDATSLTEFLHRNVRLANQSSRGCQLPPRAAGTGRDWRRHIRAHRGNAAQQPFRRDFGE